MNLEADSQRPIISQIIWGSSNEFELGNSGQKPIFDPSVKL